MQSACCFDPQGVLFMDSLRPCCKNSVNVSPGLGLAMLHDPGSSRMNAVHFLYAAFLSKLICCSQKVSSVRFIKRRPASAKLLRFLSKRSTGSASLGLLHGPILLHTLTRLLNGSRASLLKAGKLKISPMEVSCMRCALMSKHVWYENSHAHLPLRSAWLSWDPSPRSASAKLGALCPGGPDKNCSRSKSSDSWSLTNCRSVWTWEIWRFRAAWCATRLCKMASCVVSDDSDTHPRMGLKANKSLQSLSQIHKWRK